MNKSIITPETIEKSFNEINNDCEKYCSNCNRVFCKYNCENKNKFKLDFSKFGLLLHNARKGE